MKVKELKNELSRFDDNLDIDVFISNECFLSDNPTNIKLQQVGDRCVIYKTCY